MAEQGLFRRALAARVWAAVLLFLSLVASAWALSPQMQSGLNWLTAQVQPGGALSNENVSTATPLQNRDESIRTLERLAAGSATPDISQQDTTATEYLARQVLSLNAQGSNVSSQLASLVTRQNSDGGFGLHAGSASISLDSAWVLAALSTQPAAFSTAIGNLEAWLYGRVQSDGGLDGYSSRDRIQASSLMLMALEALTQDVPARNAMQQLSSWLSTQQAADGSWGENLYLTAYSLSALAPVSADATLQQSGVAWLLSQQGADGSWNDDPFLTAVILRALSLVSASPASSTPTVSGQLVDASSGMALPGVVITANGSTATATSNAQGGFVLSGLPTGSQTLNFTLSGYQTSSVIVTVPASGGVSLGGLLLSTTSGSSLSGIVTDGSSHQPIAGATITLAGTTQSTTSNAQGYYQIGSISGSALSVSVTASGYAALTTSVTLGSNGSASFSPVLYAPGSAAATGNAQLSGQILAQGSSLPLANVQVLLNNALATSTDSNGHYTLSEAGGSYTLSYLLSGFSTATAQVTANSGDVVTLPTVYLGTQATSTTISGTLTDSTTGNPLTGATVQVVGGASTTTNSAGSYTLSGLAGTQFSLRASATGYNSQNLTIQISQPGMLTENFALAAQTGQGVSIGSIATTPNPVTLNAPMVFTATYQSSGGPTSLVASLQIIDSAGNIVSAAGAYASPTATSPLGAFSVSAGSSQTVSFLWNAAEFPAGQYTVLASASLTGTLTRANPLGTVVAQQTGSFSISPQSKLFGSVTANPPVEQLGNTTPIHVTALLQSVGNIATGAHTLTAQVIDENNNPVTTLQAPLASLNINQFASLDFGSWSPSAPGSYTVNLINDDGSNLGISTTVYVGNAAAGIFSVSPTQTATGTQTVQAQVSLQGINAASGVLVDPMTTLITNALQTAVPANDAAVSNWLQNTEIQGQHCAGCHIAAQGMFGGETVNSDVPGVPRNAAARNLMLTDMNNEQYFNGSYYSTAGGSYPINSITQTLLNQWAMTAWQNTPDVIGQLVFSAGFVLGQQDPVGGGWTGDVHQAWWYDDYSTNALGAYNLNHVIKTINANPGLPIDKRIVASTPVPSNGGYYGTDSQGDFYYVSVYNQIIKVTPDGSISVIRDGPNWVQFEVGGNYLYVLSPNGLQLMDTNGNILSTFVQPGNLPSNPIFAGDTKGNAYIKDYSNNVYLLSQSAPVLVFQNQSGHNFGDMKVTDAGLVYLQDGDSIYQPNADGSVTLIVTDPNWSASTGFMLDITQRPMYLESNQLVHLDANNTIQVLGQPPGSESYSINGYGQMPDGTALFWVFLGGQGGLILAGNQPAYTAAQISGFLASYGNSLQLDWTYWQKNTPAATDPDNLHLAFALIALGNISDYFANSGQPALVAQVPFVQAKIQPLAAALYNTQIAGTASGASSTCGQTNSDVSGSWSHYIQPVAGNPTATVGDPLITAIVGYSLQYAAVSTQRNVSIRTAVAYEINHQGCDGTWQSSLMTTKVAATTWVSIFLPIALNQTAGINSDLFLTFPSSATLTSPSVAASDTQANSDGSTQYHWSFANLQNSSQALNFNLTLANLLPGEVRPVATAANLTMVNEFTNTTATEPLAIPTVTASAGLALTVGTNQTSYGANSPVAISANVSNTGATVLGGSVHLVVYAASGVQVADLGSQPFVGLPVQGTDPLSASWNTGTLLPNGYYVQATLLDANGNTVSTTQSNFTITSSSATGSLLGAGVSTDKASYGPLDTVQLDDRLTNLTSNTLAGNLNVATTITGPGGNVVWTQPATTLQQLTAGNSKDYTWSIPVSNAPSGVYSINLVVTDSSGATQATAQNSYTVQSTATSGQGISGTLSLSAATLKGRQLQAGDTLTLATSVSNQGNAALSNLPVTVSIINPVTGTTVAQWQDTIASLATGASSPLSNSWVSQGSNGQNFVATVSSTLTGSTVLAQAPFSLVVPPVTLSYRTDKTSYDINSTVNLTSTVNSQSATALSGLTLSEQITAPGGSVFWQHSLGGQTVPAGTPLTYPDSAPLGDAAPGTYQAVLSVLGANNVLLAQGSTTFTVNSSASDGAGITGTLTLPTSITAGSTTSIGYSLTDSGNAALANVPVQVIITNTGTNTVQATLSSSLASLAQGSTASGTPLSWNSGTLAPNTPLSATLQAQFGGSWVTLNTQAITLTMPVVSTTLSGVASAGYAYNSPISVSAAINNQSMVSFNPTTITWTLATSPGGTVVNTSTVTPAPTLAASSLLSENYNYTLNNAAPGNYTLGLSVNGNGLTLSTASSPLVVQSSAQAGAGLSGSLSGYSGLTAGASVPFSYVLSNAGNAALSNLPVQIIVSNTSGGSSTPVATLTGGTVASLAVNSSSTPASLSWNSTGIPSGTPLQATLQVQVGSGWITLAQPSFTLAKPVVTSSLSNVAASYAPNGSLNVSAAIQNQSPVGFSPATVNWALTNASGTVLASASSQPTLAAGSAINPTFTYALAGVAAGTDTLTVTVVGNGETLSTASDPIVIQSTAQTGAGITGTLSGLTGLITGSTASVAYSLTDNGNANLSNLPVQIVITNGSSTVATLSGALASLAQGNTAGNSLSWNTTGVAAGVTLNASLQAQFNGVWVPVATQSFSLGNPVLNATITNVAASYAYNSPVSVTANIQDQSAVAVSNATITWTLMSPGSSTVVNTSTINGATLAASATTSEPYNYTFSNAAAGNYTLMVVVSANGTMLSSQSTSLTVTSTAQSGAGVSGSLSGLSNIVAGSTATIGYSVTDAGNANLSSLPVRVLITNSGGTTVGTLTATIPSLVVGTPVSNTVSWSSTGQSIGTVLNATLQAQFGGSWINLAPAQPFTLVKPPVSTTLSGVASGYSYNSPLSVSASIQNQSTVAIPAASIVWTLTSPSGVLLNSQTVSPAPTLAAGSSTTEPYSYTLSGAAPGNYSLVISVATGGTVLSTQSATVVVTSSAQTGAGVAGTLGSLSNIVAGSTASLGFTVSDIGNASLSNLPVQVIITSSTGATVATLPTTLASVAMGGSAVPGTVSWNSSGQAIGTVLNATLQAQFGGSWVTLAPAQPFTLVKPPVGITLTGTATGYNYNSPVSVSASVQNQSTVAITGATIAWTLSNAAGTVINTSTISPAPTLAAGSTTPEPYVYAFANAAPGNYTLAISVATGSTTLATISATLVVTSTAQTGAGISGTLSNSPATATLGQTIVIGEVLANAGNAAVSNVPATLTVSQNGAMVETWSDTVTSLGMGASQNLAYNFVPNVAGSYQEQLSVSIGGKSLVLATQTLTVAAPPVKISVSPVAGSHARVLVYYSCQPGWQQGLLGWIQGQYNYACFSERQSTLTTYLNGLGVPYTLVKDDPSFTQAFRSGLYNNYWLLGAVDLLANDVTDELVEAVNRGDSLLIDSGSQYWGNYPLYQIAGVQYEGQLGFNSSKLSFAAPVYADLATVTGLSTDTQPLYFKVLSGATDAWWTATQCGHIQQGCQQGQQLDSGFYQQNAHATQYPAIVSGQYGQGKTLAIAFDLVGSLQGSGNTLITQPSQLNSGWSTMLADSLAYTTPAALTRPLIPGEFYAASFPIQNQGQATGLNLYLAQPVGGTYLSASQTGTAESNGSELFQDSLTAGQLLDLFTDQTAPATSGSYSLSLSADTSSTPSTVLGSYNYAFTVGANQASRVSTVNSEINAIAPTFSNGLALLAVKGYFNAASNALSHNDPDDAIDPLADAGNSLALISGTQAAQARSDLDLLLKLVESEWVAPGQTWGAQQCGLQQRWGVGNW